MEFVCARPFSTCKENARRVKARVSLTNPFGASKEPHRGGPKMDEDPEGCTNKEALFG
jgi:hypothetical protein